MFNNVFGLTVDLERRALRQRHGCRWLTTSALRELPIDLISFQSISYVDQQEFTSIRIILRGAHLLLTDLANPLS